MKGTSIVGFSNNRAKADFYPTPSETTEALFKRENFDGKVWECASGNGAMSKVIEKYNECVNSDIRKEESIYGEQGINFLKEVRDVDNIITNSPYKYAREFVNQAKLCANKKVAMLLKLVFLEGISRYRLFQDKEFPLKVVYVFCRRQKIYKEGKIGKNSGLIAYAWFVWDKNYKGKPIIEWIN